MLQYYLDGEFILNDDNIQERNGSGVHTTSDGAVYQGHWKDDKMNGQGMALVNI